MSNIIRLGHRSLLLLKGPDSSNLLQGLVTNDMHKLSQNVGLASFLLNIKGRIVDDFLMSRRDDDIVVECSSKNRKEVRKLLEKYRMRKKVEIVESEEPVNFSPADGLVDPRVPSFGYRVYGEAGQEDSDSYHQRRLKLGIAEGPEIEGMLPFQANGDFLNFISLDKGCYVGQELTARTAHTGVIRRRIFPIISESPLPDLSSTNETIVDQDNAKVGKMITTNSIYGLAVLPVTVLKSPKTLLFNGISIKPSIPTWFPSTFI